MEARYLTDLEWRICHAVNIYVFRNGRDDGQPLLVHIPPSKKKNMKTVMGVLQERVKYPVGYAKYLYNMDGSRVRDPCELEMYGNYVLATNFEKHYKCAAYGRKRSPLLVLNRESKHVRVLKLQNQNYYEWLLKKKAVGEERPPYIYPPYFTHENKLPQDLPAGQMGNYNPGEIHAPGCCYPPPDCGNKTYRLGSKQNYVVNAMGLDVGSTNFRDIVPLIDFRAKNASKHEALNGQRVKLNKHENGRSQRKIVEPTPSDMINANVLHSSETQSGTSSQAAISNTISSTESDEHVKRLQQHGHHDDKRLKGKQYHQHKSKSQRQAHVGSSDEYQQMQRHQKKQAASESSVVTQSSEEVVHKKSKKQQQRHHETCQPYKHRSKQLQKERKVKIRNSQHPSNTPLPFLEFGLPPPPSQFRDNKPSDEMKKQGILNYESRTMDDLNGNSTNVPELTPKKAFFYSPEKLAEISATGTIQPLELGFTTGNLPQQGTFTQVNPSKASATHTQWTTILQQQQPQCAQQLYAIETQPGGPGTPTTTTLIPAHSLDTGVMSSSSYGTRSVPQEHLQQTPQPLLPQLLQNMSLAQGSLQPIPSQQTFFQTGINPVPPAATAAPCIVIPGNIAPSPGTQLITLPSTLSQNHLQQVYQLGIVQQSNPQACIQVDAKAVRQYVNNQKLIDCRFQQQQRQQNEVIPEANVYNNSNKEHRRRQQQRQRKSNGMTTDVTESEVDIPFTPLKTYRLENPPRINEVQSHSSSVGQEERSQNPNRYRNERLPKVRSRNVAIQMGYPASGRTDSNNNNGRRENEYLDSIRNMHFGTRGGKCGRGECSRVSDISLNVNNMAAHCNKSRSDNLNNNSNLVSLQHLCPSFSSLMKTPKDEREQFFLQNSSGGSSGIKSGDLRTMRKFQENFCSSYSDHYIGRNNPVPHLPVQSDSPSNCNLQNTTSSNNPFRRKSMSVEPLLGDLATIPPPKEFRGYILHSTRHQRDHHLDNSHVVNRSSDHNHQLTNMFQETNSSNNPIYPSGLVNHSMYPYSNNNNISSQEYIYSRCQYP